MGILLIKARGYDSKKLDVTSVQYLKLKAAGVCVCILNVIQGSQLPSICARKLCVWAKARGQPGKAIGILLVA